MQPLGVIVPRAFSSSRNAANGLFVASKLVICDGASSLAQRLFASSAGNVCHEDSCRNVEVTFLQAQTVKFDLSELPLAVADPNFLMYARHSPLTSAGPGGRRGR